MPCCSFLMGNEDERAIPTAEREGWSFVLPGHLPDDFAPTRGVAAAPWWNAMRGGSFPCHESHCRRHRVAARTANAADASSAHLGFRCAAGA